MTKIITNKRHCVTSQNSSKINEDIIYSEVRLIDAEGQPVGVIPIDEAMGMAVSAGLDLVLISDESVPPVCKILDYGKFKYEQQKKKAESRKKQKTVDLKEVQIRPFIGENDLLIKCKAIKKFIDDGNKVKLVLRFRGRELDRKEFGQDVIRKVLDYCQEFAKEESPTKLEGTSFITILTKKIKGD